MRLVMKMWFTSRIIFHTESAVSGVIIANNYVHCALGIPISCSHTLSVILLVTCMTVNFDFSSWPL